MGGADREKTQEWFLTAFSGSYEPVLHGLNYQINTPLSKPAIVGSRNGPETGR